LALIGRYGLTPPLLERKHTKKGYNLKNKGGWLDGWRGWRVMVYDTGNKRHDVGNDQNTKGE